jgi:hypothetical protein
MCANQSSSSDQREERRISREAMDQDSEHRPDGNPPKPFKSECIDLTAEYEGTNIGYVDGVRMPKKET